jgi:hypothetical protein
MIIKWIKPALAFTRPVGLVGQTWMIVTDGSGDAVQLGTAVRLRLSATGSWTVASGLLVPCGPDGLIGLPLRPEALPMPTAPVGALIAKFGGSSAAVAPPAGATAPPPPDAPILIGAHCIVAVPPGTAGPLMLGFNAAWGGLAQVLVDLKVKIELSIA